MRIRSVFPILALLCANVLAFSQSITLTGHVTDISKSYDEAAACGCAKGDAATAVIDLRTYFSANADANTHRPAISIYQMTVLPEHSELALPRLAFAGNSFRLQIGQNTWVNDFVPAEALTTLAGQIQLSRFGNGDSSKTFTSLFSNGFWVKKLTDSAAGAQSPTLKSVYLDIDSRPDTLWNTTGDPIPAFDVMDQNKATILKGGSYLRMRNGFQTVVVMIDRISPDPSGVTQVDLTTPALTEEIKKRTAEINKHNQVVNNPFLSPPNEPGLSPRFALYRTRAIDLCKQLANAETSFLQSGFTLNLVSFYGAEIAARASTAEITVAVQGLRLMVGTAASCTAPIIITALASKAAGSDGSDNKAPVYKDNPENARDKFRRFGGKQGAWKNLADNSVWEKDYGKHGGQSTGEPGSAWKRWPNVRSWESDTGQQTIWPDGRIRK